MKERPLEPGAVKLLWTGGWDSTFQLLQLLLIQRRRVTPFYLIDAERRSTGAELRAMKRIKDLVLHEYPHAADLLEPTRYFAVAGLAPNPAITAAFQSILQTKSIGSQYEWLARFCRENGIHNMQLCIHRDDKAHAVLAPLVAPGTADNASDLHVGPQSKDLREYAVFRYYSFPIFSLSKIEMSTMANQQNWGPIMDLTWFCHNPTRQMKPCGKCHPCLYTMEEDWAGVFQPEAG